ncbi:serralysin [Rhodoblastus acidophilus]|uniref:Hint domain-containing protein n=1 Tax=Rhodoblastus acidophilus TaxID=1074 RepID=UPI002224172F|nr:Hint domain-containing protein [Rhodoblastus acidophilus]MCW2285290.1 serralysin [Rhodoblastus acidophilus]MCW2334246.1 serralysin [Rhodoblastus acidophilus]
MTFSFPVSISTDPNALSEISYLSGLTATDGVAARSYWSDYGLIPHKWQNGGGDAVVGTGGGVVTYAFDASQGNWTSAQKTMVVAALKLWSGIADITFVESAGAPDVVFVSDPSGDVHEYDTYTPGPQIGKIDPGQGGASVGIVINTDPNSPYGDIASFSALGGYGVGTLVHEAGHLLGLGHGGDYNGAGDNQYTVYDDRLYTVMSYISPADAAKTTSDTRAVAWGASDGVDRQTPYTPMAFDILAVEQMYGASRSGVYGGGQIFGFNCNIGDESRVFFDFTVDTAPIATLFDHGLNNTLDLSGYNMSCTVNLNQGAFSSVGGLTNNICIAYGTHIETAIGGSDDDVFYVNQDADTIRGGAGRDTVVFAGLRANYTITYETGGVVIADADTVYTLSDVETAQFSDTSETLCFLAGTRIRTPSGEAAIETLRPGDLALTADGEARPVVWLGRLKVAARFVDPVRSHPIRIRAGALGDTLPTRDLLVSPDHALLVEGLLIQAGALVNGTSIVRETRVPEFFVYYHVELDDHALVLAEGVPAETFVDNVDRMNFDNWAEHEALYPKGRVLEEMPLPRAKSRRQVPARIRAALDRRAEGMGAALAACA